MSKRRVCFWCRCFLPGYRNYCTKCMRSIIDSYIKEMIKKGWTLITNDKGIRYLK